ncbi:unnamed protein product [Meloidogyne enterolobii]|uniref:Uncharacterized protein n=1 Tax=Meloidogyne enterolobii TaxID=390850 RepID=A0ACB0XUW4_MELEN
MFLLHSTPFSHSPLISLRLSLNYLSLSSPMYYSSPFIPLAIKFFLENKTYLFCSKFQGLSNKLLCADCILFLLQQKSSHNHLIT